jgi:serine/threonine-protein kinase
VDVSPEVEKGIRRAFRPEFRIEGLLGRGGMSLVYLAHEVELNRFVALKVLPLQLSLGTDAGERFKREARIAASLDHPHIVPIHQIGSRSTFLWFTMKFVRGRSLVEHLGDRGPMDLVQCLGIVEQIASALQYAHERGVVHRDVKPANVMIDENGWALVCDFGVAKAFGAVPLTQTGGTMGTPSHMSPEQLYGQPLTGKSDQYSLAIMTYECLAGEPPFAGDSLGEVLRQHCLEPPPRLTEVRPDIPAHVSDTLVRAMSKKPEERFDEVLDFVVALGGRRPVSTGDAAAEVLGRTAPISTWRFGRTSRLRPGHLPLMAAFGGLLFAGSVALASLGAPIPTESLAQSPALSAASPLGELHAFPPDPMVGGIAALADTDTTSAEADSTGVDSTSVQALSKVVNEPVEPAPRPSRTRSRAAPPPNPRAEIEGVVRRLARAIESRSVDNLSNVHTSLSDADRRSWTAFFEAVRTLDVTLTVNQVRVTGNTASATLGAAYEFGKSDGNQGEHADSLRVTFAKGTGGWRVTSIKN